MSDDTRDIAIQTRADVKHLSDQVADLVKAVADLKEDLQQRRGAEKLAKIIHTIFGGGVGATVMFLFSKLTGIPLPR